MHKTRTRCKKNRRFPVQLYEANHLYLMNIALIKKNLQGKHHLKISSIRNEDDLSHQKRERSSKFRRQMALNMQIFYHPRNQTTRENKQKQQQYIETTRLHLQRKLQPTKKTQPKVLKCYTNLSRQQHNNSVSSPATPDTSERRNFIKLNHLYLMKIALIGRNQQRNKNHFHHA